MADEDLRRKLAVILSADAREFSRLVDIAVEIHARLLIGLSYFDFLYARL